MIMIDLFEHNKTAYDSAVRMLSETGKAAVIHPTGTGKSFIGFKLCEDNPDKKILWLSPSEYIFKTQLENLKETGAEVSENITFATYSKFSMYTEEEISEVQADICILDEFHRCGAEVWQKNIKCFLQKNTDIPVLGLSATAIRYLDNQRDMAEELFDGNIASEMTLGEAIVRGILNPPKYVLALYSYQEDLERYEEKVRRSRQKVTRDIAETYLEKLRRMLENAVGIGEIFKKHITDRAGKYIVFCSGYEHMQEMMNKCKVWLYEVDNAPHIYSVYSLDSSSDKQFEDFKADNNNEHLKLLFCIDALNEGIHVENISGVILLRPTVSPIIYKQQIGRALSASKKNNAVIFDIVNNVENLYSIGALEEEIGEARYYFESTGRSDLIINDTFKIIDEVADVKKLFAQLDEVLSASWDQMYSLAEEYYKTHNNNLEMPAGTTFKGYPLANWLNTQRAVYKGRANGILDEERKEKLEKLGMRWISLVDENFRTMYESARKYYEAHGDLLPASSYVDENGVPLGDYIRYLRKSEKQNRKSFLTDEQRKMLTEIGMDWTWTKDREWEENYRLLADFTKENPGKPVPADMKTVRGGSLKNWKTSQITAYRQGKLSGEKTEKLQEIGIYLSVSDKWMAAFSYANKFYEKNHHMNFPGNCVINGIWMKVWWETQVDAYFGKSKRHLTNEQRELLEVLNIQNHKSVAERRWFEYYDSLKAFWLKEKSLDVPADFTASNQGNMRKWICSQRTKYKEGKLSEDKIKLLNEIGMVWNIDLFQDGFSHAEAYKKEFGNLLVPEAYVCSDGFRLGEFIARIRRQKKKGTLSQSRIVSLEKLGMVWNVLDDRFYAALEDCKAFYSEHGHLRIPPDLAGEKSCVQLKNWVADCRRKLKQGKFSAEKIAELSKAHIVVETAKRSSAENAVGVNGTV